MKLAIAFILAICAFTVQATDSAAPAERSVIVSGLQNIVDGIINFAEGSLSGILNGISSIIGKLQSTINSIFDGVQQLIDGFLESIDNFFTRIVEQSETARQCVADYRPEVEDIKARKREGLRNCKENAQNELEVLQANMNEHVEVIRELTEASRNIIGDCYEKESNIVSSAGCVIEKSNELRTNLKLAVNEAFQSLQGAGRKTVEISTEMRKCTQDVYRTLREEMNSVVNEVKVCMEA